MLTAPGRALALASDKQGDQLILIGELLNWFESNYMQANPNKFQFVIFDKHNSNIPAAITSNTVLNPLDLCTLLGIQVDKKLSPFAARQAGR